MDEDKNLYDDKSIEELEKLQYFLIIFNNINRILSEKHNIYAEYFPSDKAAKCTLDSIDNFLSPLGFTYKDLLKLYNKEE